MNSKNLWSGSQIAWKSLDIIVFLVFWFSLSITPEKIVDSINTEASEYITDISNSEFQPGKKAFYLENDELKIKF